MTTVSGISFSAIRCKSYYGYLPLNSCHDFSEVIRLNEHPTVPDPVPSRVVTLPDKVTLSEFVIGASIV